MTAKIKICLDDPETRAIWNAALEARCEVASWPAWKRGDDQPTKGTPMSFQKFDDECRGCKPAMMNIDTGKVEPDDSPSMKIVLQLWSETTRAERQAWHRVTCQNSRSLVDLQVAKDFTERVQTALLREPTP